MLRLKVSRLVVALSLLTTIAVAAPIGVYASLGNGCYTTWMFADYKVYNTNGAVTASGTLKSTQNYCISNGSFTSFSLPIGQVVTQSNSTNSVNSRTTGDIWFSNYDKYSELVWNTSFFGCSQTIKERIEVDKDGIYPSVGYGSTGGFCLLGQTLKITRVYS